MFGACFGGCLGGILGVFGGYVGARFLVFWEVFRGQLVKNLQKKHINDIIFFIGYGMLEVLWDILVDF